MVSITPWMEEFTAAVRAAFGEPGLLYRIAGELRAGARLGRTATSTWWIILDQLTPRDIKVYQALLAALPHRAEVCGFLSGKGELLGWEPSDLFQFYHDTTPVWGSLDELLPRIGPEDVDRAVCIGACNIYHMSTQHAP